MLNKKLLFAALAAAVIGTGMFASTRVYAESSMNTNPMSQLVQKIATKFGLNANDVQAVFNQDRTDRRAEMEVKFEKTLTQTVTDGKLTEAKKQLIIEKHKEMQSARQGNGNGEANREKMVSERNALQEWATQNGIDIQYLMGGFGRGSHGGGFRGPPSVK